MTPSEEIKILPENTLKPYQGLKLDGISSKGVRSLGRKNPKTLSGIETEKPLLGVVPPPPEKP